MCHDYFHKNPGKVITKFNFNYLFSKAWFQALTPANLIAGFTCGVYPLNRSAIIVAPCSSNVSGSDDDPSGSGSNVVSGYDNVTASGDDNIATSDGGNDVCDNLSSDESNGFLLGDNLPDSEHHLRTALFQQEELFQRRFDEGYDLRTGPDYNRWLEINHPEVSPLSGHSLNQEASLSVLQPVSTDTNETTKLTPEVEDLESEFESSQIITPDTRDKKSNSSSTPKSTHKSTPTLFSGSSACSSSNTSLSKFLDHTVLTTPTGEPARSHLPLDKLLTSMSFLAMLEE